MLAPLPFRKRRRGDSETRRRSLAPVILMGALAGVGAWAGSLMAGRPLSRSIGQSPTRRSTRRTFATQGLRAMPHDGGNHLLGRQAGCPSRNMREVRARRSLKCSPADLATPHDDGSLLSTGKSANFADSSAGVLIDVKSSGPPVVS